MTPVSQFPVLIVPKENIAGEACGGRIPDLAQQLSVSSSAPARVCTGLKATETRWYAANRRTMANRCPPQLRPTRS